MWYIIREKKSLFKAIIFTLKNCLVQSQTSPPLSFKEEENIKGIVIDH